MTIEHASIHFVNSSYYIPISIYTYTNIENVSKMPSTLMPVGLVAPRSDSDTSTITIMLWLLVLKVVVRVSYVYVYISIEKVFQWNRLMVVVPHRNNAYCAHRFVPFVFSNFYSNSRSTITITTTNTNTDHGHSIPRKIIRVLGLMVVAPHHKNAYSAHSFLPLVSMNLDSHTPRFLFFWYLSV